MKEVASPCKGCSDRSASCHATCMKYQAYAADRQKVYERRYMAIVLNTVDVGKRRKSWQLKRSEDATKSYRYGV